MRVEAKMVFFPLVAVMLTLGWGCNRGSETPQKPIPSAAVEPTKVEPTPAPPPNPCKDPSPGPIIVLTPKDQGGKLMAAWSFDEDDTDVPQGADDSISIRFVGLVFGSDGFQLKKKTDATVLNPNKVELVIKSGQDRTLRIRREVIVSSHYFEWRFGSGAPVPLNVCDDVADNCIQDCTERKQTLPSKAFGEIVSIKVDDVDLAPADLEWLRLRADVQHPCP